MMRNKRIGKSSNEDNYRRETEDLLFVREFLNKPGQGSFAAIKADVRLSKEYKNEILDSKNVESSLSIQDCEKRINLDISCYDEKTYNNTLFKLDLLINSLKQIKDNIVKAYSETTRNDED